MRRRKLFRAMVAYVVVAWLLVEAASVVLPIFNTPPWVLQAFTFLMVLGLPLAILLAWAFDITPEGIKRDRGEAATTAGHAESLAPADPPHKSIAVLPFADLSDDAGNAYFSDGLTDEITNKLTRIGLLRVASRTAAARYREAQSDIREIARGLGVRYLLEGSVRKAADRIRTSVQLIDSRDGFNLWAEEYDGKLDDIFAVQESVAERIVEALNLSITPDERKVIRRRYTENSRAFDAYLEGQALVQYTDSHDKLMAARRHFQRALGFDPDYAAALAGLASVEVHLYRNFEPDEKHLAKARELAAKALQRGPGLARAHAAQGEVFAAEFRYAEAADKFRDALQIEDTDPWTWDALSWVLGYQQPPDAESAEQAAREAIRIQPQFTVAYYHLGRALLLQRRLDEAEAAFAHISELSADDTFARYGAAMVHLARGEYAEALEAHRAARLGGSAARMLRASILTASGDEHGALAELEAAFGEGLRDFSGLAADPYLAPLRDNPRYLELLQRYQDR